MAGFADLHNHQFAEWAFGGKLFHGRAYGEPHDALPWCDVVHGPGGVADVITNLMRAFTMGESPLGHLVGGWPEFDGWPRWDSMSHQAVHEDWLKRAVDGGLRLMVMLAVNSEHVAGKAERRPGRSKADMEAVDYQLIEAYNMQAYIDDKAGGPGEGWYRIVTTPDQAAAVMAEGKLAVVLGIEVDYLFNAYPDGSLTEQQLTAQLDKYWQAGVRHIFPIHFANNAFGGASFDKSPIQSGTLDRLVGSPIEFISPYIFDTEDGSRFGYTAKLGQVNVLGLTDLGRALIREAQLRGMVIEVDHMSRKSRTETLDMCEAADYPVCSGHTGFVDISRGDKRHEGNLTGDEVERIRKLGGIVAVIPLQGNIDEIDTFTGGATQVAHSAGGTSNTFAQAYLYAATRMGGAAVAIGTDFNGFAGLPRGRFDVRPQSTNPVVYPFANPVTKVLMDAQRTGDRTWDINLDGLAHVGMLPDLVADLKAQLLTDADLAPLMDSADGYRRMWDKAWTKHRHPDPPGGQPIELLQPTPPSAWDELPGGATDIGVGADGSAWIIGTNEFPPDGYGVFRWNGSGWDPVEGAGVRIAVDPHGMPWLVNRGGSIYKWHGSGWDLLPGGATDIAVGADGSAWIIGTNELADGYGIFKWNGSGWDPIGGSAVRIAADAQGQPWVVNRSGHIFKLRADGEAGEELPGEATDIGIGADGSAWLIGTNEQPPDGFGIHRRRNDGAWEGVDGAALQVSVGPDGIPWIVNRGGTIYRRRHW